MYKVLKTFKGSPDGFTVNEFIKDEEVDLEPSLAEVALSEKWVKKIALKKQADPVPPVDEVTDVPPAPPADAALAVPPAPTSGEAATTTTEPAAE